MRNFQPLTQSSDELTRRDQVREGQRPDRRAQSCVFDRAKQERRGGTGRHDDDAIACVERRSVRGEADEGMSERLQIRNPNEADCTRSKDHGYGLQATNSKRLVGSSTFYCSRGGVRRVVMSCWTRASIMSAPAADEDASHAAVASAREMASRRARAAFSAKRQAPTSRS